MFTGLPLNYATITKCFSEPPLNLPLKVFGWIFNFGRFLRRLDNLSFLALVVLDACVSNSGKEFQKLVSSQDFINELRPLVSRADLVGEKVRGLIKKWSKEFENEAELSLIVRWLPLSYGKTYLTIIYSFYHYLRSAGAHFPAEEGEKRRPVNTNPDAVDSQREADEIAMAIQMSLNEEKQKEKHKQEQKQPVRFQANIFWW